MSLDSVLLKVLACPQDKQPLWYFADEASLYNPRLRVRYPVLEHDIPSLLVESAEAVANEEHDRLVNRAGSDASTDTAITVGL